MTKISLTFLLIVIILSCSKESADEQSNIDEITKDLTPPVSQNTQFKFDTLTFEGKGLILSDTAKPLSLELIQLTKSPKLNGMSVSILAVSNKNYYANSRHDDCEKYPFVLVDLDSVQFWVFGSNVYQFDESKEHRRFTIGDNFINLYIGENFGEPEVVDGDLTGCDKERPIIAKYNYNDGYKAIRLGNQKYPHSSFEFATLKRFNELIKIETDTAGVTLYLKREFMESEAEFLVRLLDFDAAFIESSVQDIKIRDL